MVSNPYYYGTIFPNYSPRAINIISTLSTFQVTGDENYSMFCQYITWIFIYLSCYISLLLPPSNSAIYFILYIICSECYIFHSFYFPIVVSQVKVAITAQIMIAQSILWQLLHIENIEISAVYLSNGLYLTHISDWSSLNSSLGQISN